MARVPIVRHRNFKALTKESTLSSASVCRSESPAPARTRPDSPPTESQRSSDTSRDPPLGSCGCSGGSLLAFPERPTFHLLLMNERLEDIRQLNDDGHLGVSFPDVELGALDHPMIEDRKLLCDDLLLSDIEEAGHFDVRGVVAPGGSKAASPFHKPIGPH